MSATHERTDLTRDELARRLIAVENRMTHAKPKCPKARSKRPQAKAITVHVETTETNADLKAIVWTALGRMVRQIQVQRIEPASLRRKAKR